MLKALDSLLDACRRHQVAAGLHIVHFSQKRLSHAISEGYTLVALGMDNTLLYGAAREALEAVDSIRCGHE
jgi:hypothetical protein